MGPVWPFIALVAGGAVVVAGLTMIFKGSEWITRKLTRGRLPDHSEEGDAGFGPLYGEQGMIGAGEPESGPPLRDRDR